MSSINDVAEFAIRNGIGTPCRLGLGLVLIQTKGRKSGAPRSTPVLANRVGKRVYVSTVRRNSQWVKNVLADAEPTIVLNRESKPVSVTQLASGNWTLLQFELI